jgi:hypothetical protein
VGPEKWVIDKTSHSIIYNVYSDPMPAYGTAGSMIQSLNVFRPKRKNMCVYGHPTHPIKIKDNIQ